MRNFRGFNENQSQKLRSSHLNTNTFTVGDSYTLMFESTSSVSPLVNDATIQNNSSSSLSSHNESEILKDQIYFPTFVFEYLKMFFHCIFKKQNTEILQIVYLMFLTTHKNMNVIAEFGVAICFINILNTIF